MNKNIILTGFMGTGKSTVGKKLAKQLGYQFIDTDHLIEERIGMTIAQYFATAGETAFRQREAEVAQELATRNGLIIATGGRMMLDEANAAALGQTGLVFCLAAAPTEILKRVSSDKTVRPLLQVENPLEHIKTLLEQRRAGYERFPQIVTSGKNPSKIVRELLTFIEEK